MEKKRSGGGKRAVDPGAIRPGDMMRLLDGAYKGRRIELDFKTPLDLLVATILAAQCTDERVNRVTAALFKKYKTTSDYLRVPVGKLEEEIRPTGFYRNKARAIVNCCRALEEDFAGKVPRRMDDLTSLPGVGRKTANVVLGHAFGTPGVVVDTHVTRVAARLGLTREIDPNRIEQNLMRLIPRDRWTAVSHALVLHGRYVCKARKPACEGCVLADLCPRIGVESP